MSGQGVGEWSGRGGRRVVRGKGRGVVREGGVGEW